MNDIRIFEKSGFGDIRVVTDNDNNPWFVASDVAMALGYANPSKAIKDNIDSEDCVYLTFKASNQQFKALNRSELSKLWTGNDFSPKTLINESGLYSLILRSNLASAREFKNWVTKEVLPSIRKTGEYSIRNRRENPHWKAARLDGISSRKTLTDYIKDSGEQERQHGHAYTNYTNLAYKMALGETASKYRKTNRIDKKTNLRDCLDEVELQKLKTAECFLQAMLVMGYQYGQIVDIMEKKNINNKRHGK